MDPKLLQTVLPIAIIAVVFAFRFRNLSKPRPYKPDWQWVMPLLMVAVFGFLLVTLPPSPLGWAVLFVGLAIGAFVGMKRGHLMHLERDPVGGGLLIRQSPAALILVFAVVIVRRAFAAGTGGDPAAGVGGQIPPEAMLVTDGVIGFAFAMMVMLRWTLRQRALAVPAAVPIPAAPPRAG